MKTIGIFFGSRSPEHDVSILTAMRVIAGFLALAEYQAIPIYISKKGEWFAGEALGDIAFFRASRLEESLMPYAVSSVSFADNTLTFLSPRKFFRRGRVIKIEVAFPCIHGSFGEDGTIQGLFEMAGIPYVGCGVGASSIAMSKIHARRLLREAGIPGVPTVAITREEFNQKKTEALDRAIKGLSFPVFVKPNALGSSIAVSRASDQKELEWALEVAFQFDTTALVEQAVANPKEVNVGVIGHRDLIVSEPEEPRWTGTFQTFDEKYVIKGGTIAQSGKGKSKSVIPAEIPSEMRATLRSAAEKAFRVLGASGITRFDFMIDAKSGKWYLTEANTLPGTLQSHVWQACGIPLHELIKKLIGYAEERYEEEKTLVRAFTSSVLQK